MTRGVHLNFDVARRDPDRVGDRRSPHVFSLDSKLGSRNIAVNIDPREVRLHGREASHQELASAGDPGILGCLQGLDKGGLRLRPLPKRLPRQTDLREDARRPLDGAGRFECSEGLGIKPPLPKSDPFRDEIITRIDRGRIRRLLRLPRAR
jgi:hypothetical protein